MGLDKQHADYFSQNKEVYNSCPYEGSYSGTVILPCKSVCNILHPLCTQALVSSPVFIASRIPLQKLLFVSTIYSIFYISLANQYQFPLEGFRLAWRLNTKKYSEKEHEVIFSKRRQRQDEKPLVCPKASLQKLSEGASVTNLPSGVGFVLFKVHLLTCVTHPTKKILRSIYLSKDPTILSYQSSQEAV